MGRRRNPPTEEQIAKRRAWHDERNRRRRERYAQDAEYRQSVREQVRRSYRVNTDRRIREEPSCLTVLPELHTYGDRRSVVFPDGREDELHTFTTDELADVIGRNVQVLYRWRQDGRWPFPTLLCRDVTRIPVFVYSLEEVRAIIEIFGRHQERTPYYHRKHHGELRAGIFAATRAALAAIGISRDDMRPESERIYRVTDLPARRAA